MQSSIKGCSGCKKTKSLDEFHNDPRGRFGKQSRCKECQKKSTKTWREQSTDAYRMSLRKTANKYRAYWRTHNPYEETKEKACPHCSKIKESLDFDECHSTCDGLQSWCRECNSNKMKKAPLENVLWWVAKNRAKKRGIEFAIVVEDIVIPTMCPVLGIALYTNQGKAGPNSPSLDRIDNSKGYIPGNICVISYRANVLKGDASVDEMRRLLAYMERQ